MDLAIPIEKFDPSKVIIGKSHDNPVRKIITLEYKDNNLHLYNLVLVLDSLKVKEIDLLNNMLILQESKESPNLSKLEELRKILNTQLDTNYKKWVDNANLLKLVKAPIQNWVTPEGIVLYLSNKPELLTFYNSGTKSVISTETIAPGDFIRAVIKIQGISLQMTEDGNWTGKSRIQHHILQLYKD
jgi:hypothetical protein